LMTIESSRNGVSKAASALHTPECTPISLVNYTQ
jgi:hypothetical protein